MDSADKLVEQAIEVLRGGYTENAQSLLIQAIHINPNHEQAWLWLSGTLNDEAERRYCLQHVLKLNPENSIAQRAINSLPAGQAVYPRLLNSGDSGTVPLAPKLSKISSEDMIRDDSSTATKKSGLAGRIQEMKQSLGPREGFLIALGIIIAIVLVYVISSAFSSDRRERLAAIEAQMVADGEAIALTVATSQTVTSSLSLSATVTVAETTTTTIPEDIAPTEGSDSADTEPADTEPTDTEPADTEPADTEPADTEPADTEPADTEPADTEPANTEPADTEPVDTEPVDTEPTEPVVESSPTPEPSPAPEPSPTPTEEIVEQQGIAGYITNGGNMRSEPIISPETVIGQVCPGDQITILEEQPSWVKFVVTQESAACVPERVSTGTEGWVSVGLAAKNSFNAPAGYPELPPNLVPAVVEDVVQGNVINVSIAGKPQTVRLIGIIAPEEGECFGAEATAQMVSLTTDQFVMLELDGGMGNKDIVNRLYRHAWFPDGRLLALELVKEGYGFEFSEGKSYTYQDAMQQAEQEAEDEELGLWSPTTCGGEL